eukprot:364039-Chlamydomonas_euryale.AAC.9
MLVRRLAMTDPPAEGPCRSPARWRQAVESRRGRPRRRSVSSCTGGDGRWMQQRRGSEAAQTRRPGLRPSLAGRSKVSGFRAWFRAWDLMVEVGNHQTPA